jgi:L-rhamnose-H+ transport protein
MTLPFFLVLLAGLMNGSFATPMKSIRGWRWEHSWLIWALTGCVVFPLLAALLTVPKLAAVYGATSAKSIVVAAFFGFLWGVSAVLFGLAVDRLGLALGFGIIIGASAALGALVPLIFQHPEQIATPKGTVTLAGVSIVVLGVAGCALAGRIRERTATSGRRGSLAAGLLICFASALGAPAINFGLAFGSEIIESARQFGASDANAINAIWPLVTGSGFLANAGYCGWLIQRGRTWPAFRLERPAANWLLASTMGLLWFASNLTYGYGSQGLGELGLVLGWPVFMGAIVLTANLWGLFTGEWSHTPYSARFSLAFGLLFLHVGITFIASASRL